MASKWHGCFLEGSDAGRGGGGELIFVIECLFEYARRCPFSGRIFSVILQAFVQSKNYQNVIPSGTGNQSKTWHSLINFFDGNRIRPLPNTFAYDFI